MNVFRRVTPFPSRHFRVLGFVAGRRLCGANKFLVRTNKTERRRNQIVLKNRFISNLYIRRHRSTSAGQRSRMAKVSLGSRLNPKQSDSTTIVPEAVKSYVYKRSFRLSVPSRITENRAARYSIRPRGPLRYTHVSKVAIRFTVKGLVGRIQDISGRILRR